MDHYTILNNRYCNIVNIKDYNNYGNLNFFIQNLNVNLLKYEKEQFIHYVYLSCLKCLEISKKYNNNTYSVHVYLDNVSKKNFSLNLFKTLNKTLNNCKELDDALNTCYVYNAGTLTLALFKLIRPFIDPDTRKKILIVNTNK